MNIKAPLLAIGLLYASTAMAETPSTQLICRGANKPLMARALEDALKAKLTAEGISYKRVKVSLKVIGTRTSSTFSHDFSTDIAVSKSPFGVSFAGAYPSPTDCTIEVEEKILVVTQDNKVSRTTRNTTITGSLLGKPRKFDDSITD